MVKQWLKLIDREIKPSGIVGENKDGNRNITLSTYETVSA
jgi:hypothetical protein